MTTLRRYDGFTLLEVLGAALLFSFLLLALPTVLVTTIRTNARGRHVTAAMNLAQGKVEELHNQPYASVVDGADSQPLSETGTTGGALAMYTRRWTVSTGPAPSTKTITIRVEWSAPEREDVELQVMVHE